MKKLFVVALALAFGLTCVGLSFAQAPAVKEAPAKTGIKQQVEQAPGSAAPKPAKKAAKKAPAEKASKVKEAPAQTGIKQQEEKAQAPTPPVKKGP